MRLLIRATNWVGDAILSLPALRAVRREFPQSYISILARPYVADLYSDQGVANELILYSAKGKNRGNERRHLIQDLRTKRFDTALLLQNAFEAAWIAWRAGIPERIGYARDARRFLLTKEVPAPKRGEIPPHEKFYYLELLRRAGWLKHLPDESRITLEVSGELKWRAMEVLLESGVRTHALRIALGVGASYGSAKCWLPERFAEVANRLQSRWDADVILFGTATESMVARAIAERMERKPTDLTGKTTIRELPALLSQCHMFLGNDSGAMHVAAAVGLPAVAVFGPTDPHGTAPVTPQSAIVQEKVYCSPCFLRCCPTDHRCMTAVTADMVEDAMKPWLANLGVYPV